MLRGEIRYADLGEGWDRRPVLIVTATELTKVLNAVTCAPVTTRLRDLPTRVALGSEEGLREPSEAVCEALATIATEDLDTTPLGQLPESRFGELDRAIARALDLRRANLLPA